MKDAFVQIHLRINVSNSWFIDLVLRNMDFYSITAVVTGNLRKYLREKVTN